MILSQNEFDAMRITARLVAIVWAKQLKDAGEPGPDLRKLTLLTIRDVRAVEAAESR